MGALRVRLLGGFAVEGLDDHAVGTRKARLLLKRLAVAKGRPVSADELAAAVWGEELPSNPAEQLSVLVSRLRGVLGAGRLPRGDAGYALVTDWLDVTELEARAGEVEERLRAGEVASALAAAHVALGLARGPLLPEEEGDWAAEPRAAADRLLARARLLAAEAALAAGELTAARAAAQSALDYDPYDEAALRTAMRADAAAGRPGAALATYAAMRNRLGEELGIDPAPETDALHTAILRGEVASVAPPVGAGGEGGVGLAGRVAEQGILDRLLDRAAAGDNVAVVIDGEPGMGKTSLLSAWTARAAVSAMVLSGRCDELGRDLPLQPVVDALATHLATLGRAAATDLLGVDAATLAPLLGQTGGAAPPPVPVTVVADPEAGRAALFAALAGVLARAAGQRPVVVAVDDLHLAAASTVEFLAYGLRRIPRAMVVIARRPEPDSRDLPGARRITLAPLTVEEAVVLVGTERGEALHRRSGGHPLFLRELAAAPDGELPGSVVESVRGQLARLGEAARSVEAAALCGSEVDAELVAAVLDRPVGVVLDQLERAAQARVLVPRGSTLAFSHQLVREAIEATASPARRTAVHRAAVVVLAGRPDPDPLALARHASLGGDPALAAQALTAAAGGAIARFEAPVALALLDEAIRLEDSAPSRLLRGRLRLARLDVEGAREDALCAIELGAGVEGFELAGWVAYYSRDYDTALRYADEGVERATGAEVRASCLALGGRIRHTRGELAEAALRLDEAVATAPPAIRGTAQVWQAQLLAHRGEPLAAADVARRGLLDRHPGHPFAAGHGHFTLAYALALAGHWAEALAAVDELDALIIRTGERRFPAVAANVRGWLLRGAGQVEAARELHLAAAEMVAAPTLLEAHYAALLDVAEDHLGIGDLDGAAAAVSACADIAGWTGSMSWKHRNRYRLLGDRLASLGGGHAAAAADARALAAAAAERGDRRYEARAQVVAATAEARAGASGGEDLDALVRRFVPLSGPDGWRDLAELAAATRSARVRAVAEEQAARLVRSAAQRADVDGDAVERAVRRQLERLVSG